VRGVAQDLPRAAGPPRIFWSFAVSRKTVCVGKAPREGGARLERRGAGQGLRLYAAALFGNRPPFCCLGRVGNVCRWQRGELCAVL
jgi:hypothetical protein